MIISENLSSTIDLAGDDITRMDNKKGGRNNRKDNFKASGGGKNQNRNRGGDRPAGGAINKPNNSRPEGNNNRPTNPRPEGSGPKPQNNVNKPNQQPNRNAGNRGPGGGNNRGPSNNRKPGGEQKKPDAPKPDGPQ